MSAHELTAYDALGMPDDFRRQLRYLTRRQREFLALRADGLGAGDAADRLGIRRETLRQWYAQDGVFRHCQRAIRYARQDVARALARTIVEQAAPATAMRMVQAATAEDASSRESMHRQRAREAVLEGVGVIARAPMVQVAQQQQVALDPDAIRRAIAELRAEREALERALAAARSTEQKAPSVG